MFFENADQLAARGVLYPSYEETPAARSVNHQRLAWHIHDRRISGEALKDWAMSLAQAEAASIVLSAQDFCRFRDVSFLGVFLDIFAVEVVFYVRRQDEWVNSWYNLAVKWPYDARICRSDPVEFLNYLDEFHWIRYFDLAERWAKRIGRERVHIRVMEPGQVVDPVADIRALAGMEPDTQAGSGETAMQEERLNASLPSDQLELLRRLGTFRYPDAVRMKVINAVRKVASAAGTNVYAREIRQLIVDHFAGQNQKLASLYLGRSDGVLFRDMEFPENPKEPAGGRDHRAVYSFIRGIIREFNRGGGQS